MKFSIEIIGIPDIGKIEHQEHGTLDLSNGVYKIIPNNRPSFGRGGRGD